MQLQELEEFARKVQERRRRQVFASGLAPLLQRRRERAAATQLIESRKDRTDAPTTDVRVALAHERGTGHERLVAASSAASLPLVLAMIHPANVKVNRRPLPLTHAAAGLRGPNGLGRGRGPISANEFKTPAARVIAGWYYAGSATLEVDARWSKPRPIAHAICRFRADLAQRSATSELPVDIQQALPGIGLEDGQ